VGSKSVDGRSRAICDDRICDRQASGIQPGDIGKQSELARQIRKREVCTARERELGYLSISACHSGAEISAVVGLEDALVANSPILCQLSKRDHNASMTHIEQLELYRQ
jgi:hypothetical protein